MRRLHDERPGAVKIDRLRFLWDGLVHVHAVNPRSYYRFKLALLTPGTSIWVSLQCRYPPTPEVYAISLAESVHVTCLRCLST